MVFLKSGDERCQNWTGGYYFPNRAGCHPIKNAYGDVEHYVKMTDACSTSDQFLDISLFGNAACSGSPDVVTSLALAPGVCNNNYQSTDGLGWLARCTGVNKPASTKPHISFFMNSNSRNCNDRYQHLVVVPNAVPGVCLTGYALNAPPVFRLKIDEICSPLDEFISFTLHTSANCSDAGTRMVLRANTMTDCNVGYPSSTWAVQCYAPGVPKHDHNYIFSRVTEGTSCNQSLTVATVVIPNNKSGECVPQYTLASYPRGKPYAKLLYQCSRNDHFHTIIADSDPTCSNSTGGMSQTVLAIGSGVCNADTNTLTGVSMALQCFAPASVEPKEEQYVFSTMLDQDCKKVQFTSVTSNVPNRCNPVLLPSGNTLSYVQFETPCGPMSNGWTSTTYQDDKCTTQINQLSIVPDGVTCPSLTVAALSTKASCNGVIQGGNTPTQTGGTSSQKSSLVIATFIALLVSLAVNLL